MDERTCLQFRTGQKQDCFESIGHCDHPGGAGMGVLSPAAGAADGDGRGVPVCGEPEREPGASPEVC